MNTDRGTIAVVHLVRKHNGPAPLARFLESYRLCPGGVNHDLVVLFKGFADEDADLEACRRMLAPWPYQALPVPDRGFDIGSYLFAAQRLTQHGLCFVNSFSQFQDELWLLKLNEAMSRRGVGIAGATGSYESVLSAWQSLESFPKVFTRSERLARAPWLPGRQWVARVAAARYRPYFDGFPNPHLRTNAFLISRDVLLAVRQGPIRGRLDALRFESGKQSLTRQVLAMGLIPLVVGRDGRAYEQGAWLESCCFRQHEQENLLIADNRTQEYEAADAERREYLARRAWGCQWKRELPLEQPSHR